MFSLENGLGFNTDKNINYTCARYLDMFSLEQK